MYSRSGKKSLSCSLFIRYLRGMKRTLCGWFAILIVSTLVSCDKSNDGGTAPTPPAPPTPPTPPIVVTGDNEPLLPGNPTLATSSVSFPENYYKDNGYYKTAYSKSRGIPVWVAWHLQSDDIGGTPRQDDFRGDAGLPAGWYQVQTSDYTGSGFDRGHNCPSGDRTASIAANSSTFLMTNIIPQAANFNQGPWEGLETYTRNSLVGTTNEAFVVMGNMGTGGYNAAGLVNSLANGNVTVPAKVWKVILLIPKGTGDLARIRSTATILAVNMPNNNSLYNTTSTGKNAWRNYITTVNALETEANAAGIPLNLFNGLADSVKTILKTKLYQ